MSIGDAPGPAVDVNGTVLDREGKPIYLAFPKRRKETMPFVKLFDAVDSGMYRDVSLDRVNTRVFLYLLCQIDDKNLVSDSDRDIARGTGVSPTTVWNSINNLERCGFCVRVTKMLKKRRFILMNPHFVCKASAISREVLAKTWSDVCSAQITMEWNGEEYERTNEDAK